MMTCDIVDTRKIPQSPIKSHLNTQAYPLVASSSSSVTYLLVIRRLPPRRPFPPSPLLHSTPMTTPMTTTRYINHDDKRPHVFSDIQIWYNQKMDDFVGVKRAEERPIRDNTNVAAPASGVFVKKD